MIFSEVEFSQIKKGTLALEVWVLPGTAYVATLPPPNLFGRLELKLHGWQLCMNVASVRRLVLESRDVGSLNEALLHPTILDL